MESSFFSYSERMNTAGCRNRSEEGYFVKTEIVIPEMIPFFLGGGRSWCLRSFGG